LTAFGFVPSARPGGPRWAFRAYTAALLTVTLWPKLRVPNAVPRTDLVAHMIGFGLWTLLLLLCGAFGRVWSVRNVALSALVGVAFSGIDELLQLIPFIHRTCAWDDFGADCLGVAIVLGAALVIVARRRGAEPAGAARATYRVAIDAVPGERP
jgi:hypothetical protein